MLALDPKETFEGRLDTDPEAVFVFRYFTGREFRATGKVYDSGIERSFDGLLDALYAAIRQNLVGWRGVIDRRGEKPVEVPYDPERLEDILTQGEAWDLLGEARKEGRATSAEKNASGSSSPGDGERSATEGAADATTARA